MRVFERKIFGLKGLDLLASREEQVPKLGNKVWWSDFFGNSIGKIGQIFDWGHKPKLNLAPSLSQVYNHPN